MHIVAPVLAGASAGVSVHLRVTLNAAPLIDLDAVSNGSLLISR